MPVKAPNAKVVFFESVCNKIAINGWPRGDARTTSTAVERVHERKRDRE